ncbi:DUF2325 domain-containing protein [Aliarcobacter skirrowii]|uniref:DUF2325 domain-containing protein n=1 Tax=Aliarcobacter skirrowii TaxID=28200 RepID=UPI0029B7E07E|nr:DUF2325 domain-containing protein [Aliarcobacter skirrowii]MDX4060639.1 DUF2325 domain-containing protein [Aliarcobacter skirrowii]
MSVLVIGADDISQIKEMFLNLGVKNVSHWDARKKSSALKKVLPQNLDCIVMITSFLNHNTMYKYKTQAKKRNIPFICSKRSTSCVYEEYIKVMGIKDCSECYANCSRKDK